MNTETKSVHIPGYYMYIITVDHKTIKAGVWSHAWGLVQAVLKRRSPFCVALHDVSCIKWQQYGCDDGIIDEGVLTTQRDMRVYVRNHKYKRNK